MILDPTHYQHKWDHCDVPPEKFDIRILDVNIDGKWKDGCTGDNGQNKVGKAYKISQLFII